MLSKGFTLLEVMVALLIAVIVGAMLITAVHYVIGFSKQQRYRERQWRQLEQTHALLERDFENAQAKPRVVNNKFLIINIDKTKKNKIIYQFYNKKLFRLIDKNNKIILKKILLTNLNEYRFDLKNKTKQLFLFEFDMGDKQVFQWWFAYAKN